jgi:hypothetical protein
MQARNAGAAWLRAALLGARRTRGHRAKLDRELEGSFDQLLHVMWATITFVLALLELLPSLGTRETLGFRLALRAVVATVSTAHLLVWRSSVPLLSVAAHTWLLSAWAFGTFSIHLLLNGSVATMQQYFLGAIPLFHLQFIGLRSALFAALMCWLVLLLRYLLFVYDVEMAFSYAPAADDLYYDVLLWRGPVVALVYFAATTHVRALATGLRRSNHALARALEASRRAGKEREALLRFLCHELRSPLNSIALGIDEIVADKRAAADPALAECMRAQVNSVRVCLDDLILVAAGTSTSTYTGHRTAALSVTVPTAIRVEPPPMATPRSHNSSSDAAGGDIVVPSDLVASVVQATSKRVTSPCTVTVNVNVSRAAAAAAAIKSRACVLIRVRIRHAYATRALGCKSQTALARTKWPWCSAPMKRTW